MGLTLVGDFCQLAPVKAPYAFTSQEWHRYVDHTCLLTEIKRQDDPEFVRALQAVRRGDATRALEFFGPRLVQQTDMQYDGSTLFAKNDPVTRYNIQRLEQLSTPVVSFASTRWGKLRSEWGGPPKPPDKWGIPPHISLKDGALVMILANKRIDDSMRMCYVNGDLGEFLGEEDGRARLRLRRTGEEVMVEPITRFHLTPLEPGRRKELVAEGHADRIKDKMEIIGGITYMPLRVAYASTVHKTQGLTLDAVQVNIRDHFFRSYGMLYVALRCRTADGLRLVGDARGFVDRCRVDPQVREWV
ncbi:hypothetical protein LCGC14_2752470 [marine sediment metagenome]|uniref:UvrD-like helicase C-terminal domain-containing protein n=1 Tax=marine sediment metagenome TaxID=412755 RepID=A0A0F9B9Z3_9ZZZZ